MVPCRQTLMSFIAELCTASTDNATDNSTETSKDSLIAADALAASVGGSVSGSPQRGSTGSRASHTSGNNKLDEPLLNPLLKDAEDGNAGPGPGPGVAVAVPLNSDGAEVAGEVVGEVRANSVGGASAVVGEGDVGGAMGASTRWSHIMTLIIFGSQFLVALCVDSVAVIWSIVGSTVSIMVSE